MQKETDNNQMTENKEKKKKKQSKAEKRFLLLLEILCAVIFIYSGVQLFSIYQDYHKASEEYASLSEMVVEELPSETGKEKEETTKEKEEKKSVLDEPYDYDVPSYKLDLSAVEAQNPDTEGWIILPDSKINYPIVKSVDNEDYLRTTFDHQPATAGTLFIDMNCKPDFENQNTIVYGHNMHNGSMFRALNSLTDKEYFWRHHIFLISTGGELEEYEIISCYETTVDNMSSWQISFESDAAYAEWLKNVTARCNYDCVPYDTSKNTITLSTCRGKSGGPGRFIVHLQKK